MFTKHERKLIDMLKNDYVLHHNFFTGNYGISNGIEKKIITYKTVDKFFDLKIIKKIVIGYIEVYTKYEFIDNYNHIDINEYHVKLESLKQELKTTKNTHLLPQIKRIKQIIKEVIR